MKQQTYTILPLIWNTPDPHGGLDSYAPFNLGHYHVFKIKGLRNKYGVQHNGVFMSTGHKGVAAAQESAQEHYDYSISVALSPY